MTATDFVELPRLTDPRLSPIGDLLVYRRSEAIWDENEIVRRLRLVDLGSGKTRHVVEPEAADESFGSVVWARDGSGFLLTLEREDDESKQAYFYDIDSRQLVRLTDHAEDVGSISWAPNSDGFFFRSRVALTGTAKADIDDGWTHEAYDTGANSAVWYHDRASGESHELFGAGFHVRGYSVSRDGTKILYSRTDHTLGDRPDSELWLFDVRTKVTSRITENGFAELHARLSPDNTKVAFIATVNSAGEHYYEDNVFVQAIGDKSAQLLLPDLAMEMLDLAWDRSGDGLFLLGNTGVRTQLYHYSLESNVLTAMTEGDSVVSDWQYDASLDEHTFVVTTAENPGEVWRLRGGAEGPEPVTGEFAKPLDRYRIPEQRVFQWQARDGVTLEGVLVFPVDYADGQRFPLVTITHGGPRSSSQFGSWRPSRYPQVLAGEGYFVFLPNHRGGTGYGDAFMRDMVGEYFNNAHLDILDGIDALIGEGLVDPDQLVKMGWSAGGHMTNKLVTVTDRFRAASSGAGAADWVSLYGESDLRFYRSFWFGGAPWDEGADQDAFSRQSMLKDAWRITTPTLFFVGEDDERVPPTQAIMMFRGARASGVETQLFVVPDEPHNYGKPKNRLFKINTELAWFARHLGRAPYEASYPAGRSAD